MSGFNPLFNSFTLFTSSHRAFSAFRSRSVSLKTSERSPCLRLRLLTSRPLPWLHLLLFLSHLDHKYFRYHDRRFRGLQIRLVHRAKFFQHCGQLFVPVCAPATRELPGRVTSVITSSDNSHRRETEDLSVQNSTTTMPRTFSRSITVSVRPKSSGGGLKSEHFHPSAVLPGRLPPVYSASQAAHAVA